MAVALNPTVAGAVHGLPVGAASVTVGAGFTGPALTVTVAVLEVPVRPPLSVTTAVTLCVPAATLVQLNRYGLAPLGLVPINVAPS